MVPMTLAEMIGIGHYDVVQNGFDGRRFPLIKPKRLDTDGLLLFRFPGREGDNHLATDSIVQAMVKQGYEPAYLEQLMAYGAWLWRPQPGQKIFALGTQTIDEYRRHVAPFLSGGDRKDPMRVLGYGWEDHGFGWHHEILFLGVRLD